jgi:hypothetical protein
MSSLPFSLSKIYWINHSGREAAYGGLELTESGRVCCHEERQETRGNFVRRKQGSQTIANAGAALGAMI